MNHVDHDGAVIHGLEMVFMIKAFKITFYHFIGEKNGPLHGADLSRKTAGSEKMPCFPGNCFVFIDQPADHTGYCFFIGLCGRDLVQVDAAAQVEDPFNGGADECGEMNFYHL